MPLIVDAHVHVYPCHDACVAFGTLVTNLQRWVPGARMAALLTERSDCSFFAALQAKPDLLGPAGFAVETAPGAASLRLRCAAGGELYVFAGRQVATAERIEVLALLCRAALPDGRPVRETLDAVRAAGGVPALAWAPGKWWFGRGRKVRQLFRDAGRTLCLGDSSLRPGGWPEPALMRRARRMGIPVLAGSDALPFAGEERWLGRYATRIEADLDPGDPEGGIRRLLSGGETVFRPAGRRCSAGTVLRRLYRNARCRPQSAAVSGSFSSEGGL